ncbi:class I SAM-dependent methyltransferase [Marinactinospora rubrisoli]|uniref:Class I SAM-dependent methyltransferase n=1 Tax=Marinactinospora rubrisoli TaxID=2715399 RepID=A0ABW2KNX8_9ACTN
MRMPSPRLWAPPAVAGAVGVAVLGVLVANGTVDWIAGVQLLALWGLALAVGLLLLVVRRISRNMDRLGRRLEKYHKSAASEGGIAQRLESMHRMLRLVRDNDVPSLHADARQLGSKLMEEQRGRFDRLTKHVTEQGRRDYQQQVAERELREFIAPDRFMPALRGWAASPDVLCVLVEKIRERRPGLVVECGSGASSVWLGLALRRVGEGRLVALEHDERYAELSRDLVAAHGLSDVVEVRYAPLRPWSPKDPEGEEEAQSQPWYDLDAIADLTDIDLLFVDGPPGGTARLARYPAGPVLLPRCSPRAVVVLDDTVRTAEQETSDRWLADHPGFDRVKVETEKGTHVLTRK